MNSGGQAEENFLYRRLAEKIIRQINSGALRVGERIPAVRKASVQEGVSISTVVQAYVTLESLGFVEARPQSGYYVRSRREHPRPEPNASKPSGAIKKVDLNNSPEQVRAAWLDSDLVPLGAALPAPELLPTVKLNRISVALSRRAAHVMSVYNLPPGNFELRRQIAKRSLDWGCTLAPDEIVLTNGATEAMSLALRALTNPGETIAVESPTYFGILQLAESLGLKIVEIPMNPRVGMCLDSLENFLKNRRIAACVGIPNFNNPLGSLMPDENKRRLLQMLGEKNVPLIENDVYGDLYFGETRPLAAQSFDSKGLALLCGSFSKTLAPGLRVGWIAPGGFKAKIEKLQMVGSLSTPALPQMTIAEFIESGLYDRHLRRLKTAFAAQIEKTAQAVAEYFPENTKITRPQGGFVLWIELPKTVDSVKLQQAALAERISISPGSLFSANGKYRHCIRLNCGHPWSNRLNEAIKTIAGLLSLIKK